MTNPSLVGTALIVLVLGMSYHATALAVTAAEDGANDRPPLPADAWAVITDRLAAGEEQQEADPDAALALVAEARSAYDESIGPAAAGIDLDSHTIILDAFSTIAEDHAAGNVAHAALMRQAVDKTVYRIAYVGIVNALEAGDPRGFETWFDVMERKFALSEKRPELYRMAADISAADAGSDAASKNAGPVVDGLLEIFKVKTLEEPEEAIIALGNDDLAGAQKFAYEGYYYYRTLYLDVEKRLGTQRADDLLGHMAEMITITESGRTAPEMAADAEAVLDMITGVIREYEGQGGLSDAALALAGIRDRLRIVDAEYVDAVRDGEIVDRVEYDEAAAFLKRASAIYAQNTDAFAELSGDDTRDLGAIMSEMDGVMSSVGDASEVSILVGRGINRVAALETLAGGAVDADVLEYFDEIERLLGEAQAAYRGGDADTAFDLVSTAYLDNYEFVEEPLGQADPELMEKIETDMREDLRAMIRDGAPAGDVDAQIGMILSDLDSAKAAIPEFGAIVMVVMAVAVAAALVASSRSRLGLPYRR